MCYRQIPVTHDQACQSFPHAIDLSNLSLQMSLHPAQALLAFQVECLPTQSGCRNIVVACMPLFNPHKDAVSSEG